MKGLLLIAHGSPRIEANTGFITLSESIQKKTKEFIVAPAFLGSSPPTIGEGFESLAKKGLKKITVLPYFLVEGNHTVKDIPETIQILKNKYPDIKVTLLKPIGLSDQIPNLILSLI